jgi:hypothetical protein
VDAPQQPPHRRTGTSADGAGQLPPERGGDGLHERRQRERHQHHGERGSASLATCHRHLGGRKLRLRRNAGGLPAVGGRRKERLTQVGGGEQAAPRVQVAQQCGAGATSGVRLGVEGVRHAGFASCTACTSRSPVIMTKSSVVRGGVREDLPPRLEEQARAVLEREHRGAGQPPTRHHATQNTGR